MRQANGTVLPLPYELAVHLWIPDTFLPNAIKSEVYALPVPFFPSDAPLLRTRTPTPSPTGASCGFTATATSSSAGGSHPIDFRMGMLVLGPI